MVSNHSPDRADEAAEVPSSSERAEHFTPGPWHIWGLDSKRGELTVGIASERGAEKHIAYLAWNKDSARNPGEATGLDDARLIASAPDLYEALKELLEHSGYEHHDDDSLRHEAELGNGFAPVLLKARAALSKARSGEPGKMEGGE